MGSWYRIKKNDQIVFCPNTSNTDTERAYVHDNLFPDLYDNNRAEAYGYDLTVLHRDMMGGCATVIVYLIPNKSNQKKTAGKFVYNLDLPTFGDYDVDVAHLLYSENTIPDRATEPYSIDRWNAIMLSKSKNTEVASLPEVLQTLDVNGHGHICDKCMLPYVHEHALGKWKDSHSLKAAHPQFIFDCPYPTCELGYNHVDCPENCTLPNHHNARLELSKKTQNAFRLDTVALIKLNTVLSEAESAGILLQPNDKIMHVAAVIDEQVVNEDAIVARPFNENMNLAGTAFKYGQYFDTNPITKAPEVYICNGTDGSPTELRVINSAFSDVMTFQFEGGVYCITGKNFNRLLINAFKAKTTNELNKILL